MEGGLSSLERCEMCSTHPTAQLSREFPSGEEESRKMEQQITDGRGEAAARSVFSNCRVDLGFALTWSS